MVPRYHIVSKGSSCEKLLVFSSWRVAVSCSRGVTRVQLVLVVVISVGGSRQLNSTLNLSRMLATTLKLITQSAGVTNALLASYDTKLVAYYSQ